MVLLPAIAFTMRRLAMIARRLLARPDHRRICYRHLGAGGRALYYDRTRSEGAAEKRQLKERGGAFDVCIVLSNLSRFPSVSHPDTSGVLIPLAFSSTWESRASLGERRNVTI
jgi:hypothetical protein